MKEDKILFLYPPTVYANHSMFKHFTYFGETIDVISRYYKNIKVLDCAVEQIEQKIIFNNFKDSNLLVMEIEPYNIDVALSLGKLYKSFNSKGKIIVYGTAITIMPNYFMKQHLFDYIINDGNFAVGILGVMNEILNTEYPYEVKSKYYELINGEYIMKGDNFQLPIKDWGVGYNKLLPLEKYKFYNNGMFELTVQTGCPFNCSFCSEKILFDKYCGTKYRDVEDIIKIMKNINDDFNEIYFSATTMTANRKWTENLCTRLIEEGNKMPWRTVTRIDCVDEELLKLMKKSGLKKICFGVETFDDKLLEEINKKQNANNVINILKLCNKLGIKAKALLMLGIPGQTAKNVFDTVKILKDLNVEYRFKEYSPIREAHILDSKNSDISDMIPIFSRYEYRTSSIPGITSEEYMELLFPTEYVR
ncbi:MAG: radical SAM protein [Bacilli bacterium]|nr:radical SAM protein [Bacilli bacterium]